METDNEDLKGLSDNKLLMLAASALEDTLDGMDASELRTMTGWSLERCERIMGISREASRRFALPSVTR